MLKFSEGFTQTSVEQSQMIEHADASPGDEAKAVKSDVAQALATAVEPPFHISAGRS